MKLIAPKSIEQDRLIPKIIHYCWFGKKPLPALAKKCLKSWQTYCPDYEIKRWDESNFDINICRYVKEAYEAKKYAFVTDFVRLWALVNFGGIYMDTDVEVLKPLDPILTYQAVSGFEDETFVPTGLMAAEKGFALFAEFLHEYDTLPFLLEDGKYNLVSNVVRITEACEKLGLKRNNTQQTIAGFTLLPSDYFCPKNYQTRQVKKTPNTYTIHHFMGSWCERDLRTSIYFFLVKCMGAKRALCIVKQWQLLKAWIRRKF